ncbi:Apolipoprotein L6 [Labeo rohita]|uniref:Apolipoprotein L6 n=1 Tax=Labeo rohita TaxID=84645 RepID=A0ABQ8MY23_LABRO|nr:Apolipoprotein L6 [Labeo rohita]
MDTELSKIDDNCGDHSTTEVIKHVVIGRHLLPQQGMENTQQSLEPCEKPDDKQSKSMRDSGLDTDALVDVESQPTYKEGDNSEILEKKPDTMAETPEEEENPKQKAQKKKPRNPFMPQVAAKNKTTPKKNENQNEDSGSDLAETKGHKKSLMEWLDEFRLKWEDMPKSDNMTEKEEAKAFAVTAEKVQKGIRVFNKLFSERAEGLWQHVIDLHAIADGLDRFNKKTKIAQITGGSTSAVGGVATITGLILAPFTMGTSLIVTAVGLGVAMAGGLTSASAGISNTVNNSLDRKKVERIVEDYQAKMADLNKCMKFIKQGITNLRKFNLNKMKKHAYNRDFPCFDNIYEDGAMAGKAILTSANEIMRVMQVANAAGTTAARAVQIASISTGVLTGLFVGMDIYFVAKDSHELKNGAKSEFAAKIREVADQLHEGLMELNIIRDELRLSTTLKEDKPALLCSVGREKADSMSRRSDVVEHSSEARQYMFKGAVTGSFHTKDENGELMGSNDSPENSKIKNKLTECELSGLNDQPTGNNNPKGKAAVFSRLFNRTSKKWTSLSAQEDGFTADTNSPSSQHSLKEELSLQHGELSAGNHNQTQNTNNKEELALKNEDFPGSDRLERNSLFNFLKTSPRGTEDTYEEDSPPLHIKLLASNDSLLYLSNNNIKENSGKLSGTFRSSPKPALRFPADTDPLSEHSKIIDWDYNFLDNGIEKKSIAVPRKCHDEKLSNSNNKGLDEEDIIEEPVEMQKLGTNEASYSDEFDCSFEILPVEMAAYPTDSNVLETDEDDDLMDWWETVEDRVFMAARLFVSLFNQRGASLQCRILELLALADTADNFHKKTVSAAVGGGVASVAGGIATITGLILAPFTFGTSTIVTAVGISVATAGSITSATANITDAVQSKMDRKKYVMKEGGRAGKALMINTDRLISTVKVLGVAGGAAKAAKAISITTGVMSTLFLALDVFFLAKDSNELRRGAKTKFASKLREVCKELQHGLLELNKVKTQLQKTMDGIEVEEYEEEEEDEDQCESDPVKLALLEEEIDQLEEKLDQKTKQQQMNQSKRGDAEKETPEKKENEESYQTYQIEGGKKQK